MSAALLLVALAAAPPRPSLDGPLLTLKDGPDAFGPLAFSRDGTRVAVAVRKGPVRVFRLPSGELEAALVDFVGEPAALALSPDGARLACVTSTRQRVLWDVPGRRAVARDDVPGDAGYWRLAFADDGRRFAGVCRSYGTSEKAFGLAWDAATGKEVARLPRVSDQWGGLFSPDLRMLGAANYQDVDLYEVATGRRVASLLDHPGRVASVAFSRDGARLAVAVNRTTDADEEDAEVWLWDVPARKRVAAIRLGRMRLSHVALSPAGDAVAAAGVTRHLGPAQLRVLAADTGAELARLQPSPGLRWWLAPPHFTPEGAVLAAGSDRESLRVWRSRPLAAPDRRK